jgi:hypothetical protein
MFQGDGDFRILYHHTSGRRPGVASFENRKNMRHANPCNLQPLTFPCGGRLHTSGFRAVFLDEHLWFPHNQAISVAWA